MPDSVPVMLDVAVSVACDRLGAGRLERGGEGVDAVIGWR